MTDINLACIQRRKLLDGTVSYRIQVKAKNQRIGKFEAKAITWKKPLELTETQAKKELQRIALELGYSQMQSVKDWLSITSHHATISHQYKAIKKKSRY